MPVIIVNFFSWLVYEDYDPYGQLAWLVDVLSKAEKNGEYVHILYHFPTGINACLGTWSREYARIISRFSETVTGQFSGHTHYDQFFLFYDEANSSKVVNVGFNGASLSPLSGNNPSYKIYDINGANFGILDVEEWSFSLDEANKDPEKESLDWYKLYSFIEAYGVKSMEPESIGKFVKRLARNRPLLEKYNKYKHRMGKAARDVCDDECNKDNLCLIVKSHLADEEPCKEIINIYDGYHNL
ncbi:hypothetical protein WA026_002918 [Henosepilachna vigintioctopunctata]|uniref:Sphingomyelin phosphodiesterase C-terminal domain-containing protein n=1 Tax=Henosepilachna vigintioctopunctata TaxID=420089 RepID=A0AAW1TLS3_9CUCU